MEKRHNEVLEVLGFFCRIAKELKVVQLKDNLKYILVYK